MVFLLGDVLQYLWGGGFGESSDTNTRISDGRSGQQGIKKVSIKGGIWECFFWRIRTMLWTSGNNYLLANPISESDLGSKILISKICIEYSINCVEKLLK